MTRRNFRFRNWAGTYGCTAAEYVRPASEEEVVALVKRAAAEGRRVRLVGAGHSWSDIALTDSVLANLDGLDRIVAVDADRHLVTVEAGIRLRALNEQLALRGLALPVMGSVDAQSVAGAIATGTHGSAPRVGNLASAVAALRLVTADGSVRDLSRENEPEIFAAVRVGLGALGVITRVTLQCVPAFKLEELAEPLAFDDALAAMPALLETEPFVKLWWLPHTGKVQVVRYRETSAPSTFNRLARWLDETIVNRGVFAFLLLLGRLFPGWIPALNRLVGGSYFKKTRRVARSDRALTLPMPPAHDEMEWALPRERAAEAFRWVRELVEREKLRVNFIVELRFVAGAGDDAWLSPCYGRDTCYLGAYMAETADRARYFAAFEKQMLAWGGRPHWGKRFEARGDALRALYPRWDDFAALRRRLDPNGMFENDFVRRLFAV